MSFVFNSPSQLSAGSDHVPFMVQRREMLVLLFVVMYPLSHSYNAESFTKLVLCATKLALATEGREGQ